MCRSRRRVSDINVVVVVVVLVELNLRMTENRRLATDAAAMRSRMDTRSDERKLFVFLPSVTGLAKTGVAVVDAIVAG